MSGLIGAVIAPQTPLLLPGTGGALGNTVVAEVLERAVAEIRRVQALSPDRWVVLGAADLEGTTPPGPGPDEVDRVTASIAPWPGRRSDRPSAVPQNIAIGLHLLGAAGVTGRPDVQLVPTTASTADCARIGAEVARPGTALLVLADGSARRTRRSPGDFDERAEPFDDVVEKALAEGDLDALADLDPELAEDLLCRGRESLQALVSAFRQAGRVPQVSPDGLLATAPLGVRYWVTSWT